MTSQAALGVTTGQLVTEAWGDDVARHLLTTETGTPASVFDGKAWSVPAEDRIYVSDGATSRRVAHYSPSGRTGGKWSGSTQGVGVGVSNQLTSGIESRLIFSTETADSDGFIAANAASILFTVPAGCAGAYVARATLLTQSGWAASPNDYLAIVHLAGGVSTINHLNGSLGGGSCVAFMDLAVGDTLEVRARQSSGGVILIAEHTLHLYRVGV